jgi:quercetin dioxygenase-like cupin family protein
MKSFAKCSLLGAVVIGSVLLYAAHQGRWVAANSAPLPQPRAPMRVTRIYRGADGQTHAEQVEMKLGASIPDISGLEQSETVRVSSINFVRFAPGFFEDWHNAHARRYVITLTGRGEVELGGGQKITLEPGRVLLAEDLTGKGHITRALTADWTAAFVQVEE